MLENAAARIAPDVARRSITLSVEPGDRTTVRTDAQKLERAIENLLDNARKFTPDEGRISVRIGGGSAVTSIEIANTADGLDADELPRLFDRFYRRERGEPVDGSRRRQAGSGLGLPIARDLAQLLGGKLDASLRDGQLVMTLEIPSRPRVHESR